MVSVGGFVGFEPLIFGRRYIVSAVFFHNLFDRAFAHQAFVVIAQKDIFEIGAVEIPNASISFLKVTTSLYRSVKAKSSNFPAQNGYRA